MLQAKTIYSHLEYKTLNGNLLGLVGSSGQNGFDWQRTIANKLTNSGVKVFNKINVDFDNDLDNNVGDLRQFYDNCGLIFGYISNYKIGLVSQSIMLEMASFYQHRFVTVVPDFVSDDMPQDLVKLVNVSRAYYKDSLLKYGAIVFEDFNQAIDYVTDLYNNWHNAVMTLGACGKTTWRQDVIDPHIQNTNFRHENPQVEHWTKECVVREQIGKNYAYIKLLNLTDFPDDQITYCLSSMNEAIDLALDKQNLILVYDHSKNDMIIANCQSQEFKDSFLTSRRLLELRIYWAKANNPNFYVVPKLSDALEVLTKFINWSNENLSSQYVIGTKQ